MSKKLKSIHGFSEHRRSCMVMNIIGGVFIVLGLLQLTYWKTIFNCLIAQSLVLKKGQKSFDVWKTPPVTLTLDFYLFNWTNPQDFQNQNIKPKFQQLGPYRFEEKPTKVDIEWHEHNSSVTYRRLSHYIFDEEGSVGKMNDTVFTINSLAVAISRKVKYRGMIDRGFIDLALKWYQDKLTLKKKANELLFDGYNDLLLTVGNNLPRHLFDVSIPYDKYGYCYGRNNTKDFYGPINIYTGADDINKIGRVHTWKNSRHTTAYGEQCNNVRGSMGEFQTPHLRENGSIEYFVPDLCRPMELEYAETVEVEGISGFKYVGGDKAIDNGTLYPENACYCNGECVPSGVMNITSCWYDSPVFMSYPHFYKADPSYLEDIDGLNPNQEEHEMFIVLEPETAAVIDLGARLQVNILVEPMNYLSMFRNSRKIFFPLFWIEERTRVTPQLAEELKMVPNLSLGIRLFGWFGLLLGVVLCAWYPIRKLLNRNMLQQLEINGFEVEEPTKVDKDPRLYPLVDKLGEDLDKIEKSGGTLCDNLPNT